MLAMLRGLLWSNGDRYQTFAKIMSSFKPIAIWQQKPHPVAHVEPWSIACGYRGFSSQHSISLLLAEV